MVGVGGMSVGERGLSRSPGGGGSAAAMWLARLQEMWHSHSQPQCRGMPGTGAHPGTDGLLREAMSWLVIAGKK